MLFGCPQPPAPKLWKLEKKFLMYKSISHLIFSIIIIFFFFFFFFFFWEFWSLRNIFQVVVVNLLTF